MPENDLLDSKSDDQKRQEKEVEYLKQDLKGTLKKSSKNFHKSYTCFACQKNFLNTSSILKCPKCNNACCLECFNSNMIPSKWLKKCCICKAHLEKRRFLTPTEAFKDKTLKILTSRKIEMDAWQDQKIKRMLLEYEDWDIKNGNKYELD